jgi:hypothetical protein
VRIFLSPLTVSINKGFDPIRPSVRAAPRVVVPDTIALENQQQRLDTWQLIKQQQQEAEEQKRKVTVCFIVKVSENLGERRNCFSQFYFFSRVRFCFAINVVVVGYLGPHSVWEYLHECCRFEEQSARL